MARPRDDMFFMNYEDTGFQPTIEDIIAQISAPIEQPSIVQPTVVQPTRVQPTTPTQSAQSDKNAIIDKLASQIKAQGTTDKWTGGYGADAATKDMARILADTGITDISQFGPVTKEVELYMGEGVDGTPIYQKQTEQTFGNKLTGQPVANTYSERQTGNAFGGTFEGKGNTGYRVDFTPEGTPIFYTTGASSRTDISAFAPIIAAALTPVLGPAAAALLGPTSSALATGALTGALVGGGTAAITGDSIGKGALLGGAGGVIGNLVSPYIPTPDAPIDFVGGTQEQIDDALRQNFVKDLKAAGVTNVSEFISNVGGNAFTPTEVAPVAPPIENVQVTAPVAPTPTINELVNAIAAQQPITPEPVVQPVENVQVTAPTAQPTVTPTVTEVLNSIVQQAPSPVEITAPKPVEQVSPQVINAVNAAIQANVTQPVETVSVTGQTEKPATVQEVINAITSTPITPEIVVTAPSEKLQEEPKEQPISPVVPIVSTPISTAPEPTKPEEKKEKTWTASELAELARLGLLATTVLGVANDGPTGFPIVPIPADWKSPTYGSGSTSVASKQLPPIDFGSRELLRGTQWEKFLDPNYGQVPTPVQFNQPTNMSYDRLMSILGTGRDVMPSQALTINDVISGIQSQYGQTP